MDVNFDFDEKIEKLAKVPRSARLAAVLGVLALIGAGYYFLSYVESKNALNMYRGRAHDLQRKLTNVRAVANNLDDFGQEVAGLERELHLALKQLPDKKQFEDLLRDISTAGKKVGVRIKSLKREPEVPHEFYAEVPFALELEGNYHHVAMFFERVSRLPRIVNVGSMKVVVVKETADGIVLRVAGMATTFRFLSDESETADLGLVDVSDRV
jgi:type IV pilus assembly protein PilO